MTIIVTPGATANSFISVEGANAYFSERLYSDVWECASTGEKGKALKQATRQLDALGWIGWKTDRDNSLRWPRNGVYDSDGLVVDSAVIPKFIERATCELAIDLLVSDNTTTSAQDSALIKSVKAGPVAVEFAVADKADKVAIESNVISLISHYLAGSTPRILRA